MINIYKQLKYQSKIKQCLHPHRHKCSEIIIDAHSIQNNKILKQISDNGQIFMPFSKNNLFSMGDIWGRREATVFTGFCGFHDNELFKPIENNNFDYSDEHIFLYSYRCFAFGYHRQLENSKMQKSIIKDTYKNNILQEINKGIELSINDLMKDKEIFDKAIINKQYDILTSVVWEFEKTINFAAIGFTVLNKDIYGNVIQDIFDINTSMKHLFFTIFPEGNKSYCILSWIKNKKDIFENYKNQLLKLSNNERIKYLNNLIPMETENIVIKPSSWESLEQYKKEEFMMLIYDVPIIFEHDYNMLDETSFNLFDL